MDSKTLLANIPGTVDQELLLRNEYLGMENRILHNQLSARKLVAVPAELLETQQGLPKTSDFRQLPSSVT
jgi:hypothetical protein